MLTGHAPEVLTITCAMDWVAQMMAAKLGPGLGMPVSAEGSGVNRTQIHWKP